MICPKCGRQLDGLFCEECGIDISKERIVTCGSDHERQLKIIAFGVCEAKKNESVKKQAREAIAKNKAEIEGESHEKLIKEHAKEPENRQRITGDRKNETKPSKSVDNKPSDSDEKWTYNKGSIIAIAFLLIVVFLFFFVVGYLDLSSIGSSRQNKEIMNMAWGPQDRETFTNEVPAGFATFNSITNNAAVGDERNFVRIREVDSKEPFTDEIRIESGKEYEIYVYYQNDASSSTGESGTAHDVTAKIMVPFTLEKGYTGVIKGVITSSDTNPKYVWDSAYINADEDVALYFVENSAVLHCGGDSDGEVLNAEKLFDDGVPFSPSKDTPGEIPSTDEGSSGHITLRIKVRKSSTIVLWEW